MTSDILVTNYMEYPAVAAYMDNRLEYLSLLHGSDLGDVYLCKVSNLVKNISGAFVNFGADKVGYIPLKNVLPITVVNRSFADGDSLRQGDEIILQVDAEEQKLKKARMTSNISVSGRYTVVTLGKTGVGVSKKLPEELRISLLNQLKNSYHELCEREKDSLFGESFGVIIRTEAAELPDADRGGTVLDDMKNTFRKLLEILDTGRKRTVYSCLYKSKSNDVDEQILKARNFLKGRGAEEVRVLNESVVYSLSTDIDKLVKNRVWLKSGAFLIIEQLESFNAIDVNTGKAITGKKDITKKVNEEAALEIMRQIRLRNLTGMILIDFINMKDRADTEDLCNYVRALCKKESIHTEFVDITGLGIVELTRSKNDKSLKEILQNQKNPVDMPDNAC